MLKVVEDGADDQSHDKVAKKLRERQFGISDEQFEASPHAETDLLAVRKSVGRLDASVGFQSQ